MTKQIDRKGWLGLVVTVLTALGLAVTAAVLVLVWVFGGWS